jgi:AcrR family transcriptional regulator
MVAAPTSLPELSPTKAVRRDRILDAAQRVFTRIGLKAASVEAIAAEAGVSKATLYAYFPDKVATFTAVAERLAHMMRSGVTSALAADGTLQERIANALIAKHSLAFDVVIGSANAVELLATRNHLVGAIFRDTDAAIESAIASELQPSLGQSAKDTARLLFYASIGLSEHARAKAELEADLSRLVRAVLHWQFSELPP